MDARVNLELDGNRLKLLCLPVLISDSQHWITTGCSALRRRSASSADMSQLLHHLSDKCKVRQLKFLARYTFRFGLRLQLATR